MIFRIPAPTRVIPLSSNNEQPFANSVVAHFVCLTQTLSHCFVRTCEPVNPQPLTGSIRFVASNVSISCSWKKKKKKSAMSPHTLASGFVGPKYQVGGGNFTMATMG